MTACRPETVLFVDPFGDEREMFSAYLEAVGFRVLFADTSDSALKLTNGSAPDAVVIRSLSIRPATESLILAREMRQSPPTWHTPIILLTTDGYSDRTIATQAGCDLVLLLPVFPEDLAAAISRLVDSPNAVSKPVTVEQTAPSGGDADTLFLDFPIKSVVRFD
jgi:CheY-like chemotaxis protein